MPIFPISPGLFAVLKMEAGHCSLFFLLFLGVWWLKDAQGGAGTEKPL